MINDSLKLPHRANEYNTMALAHATLIEAIPPVPSALFEYWGIKTNPSHISRCFMDNPPPELMINVKEFGAKDDKEA